MENKKEENRIALLRKERGWSQSDLGDKLFISRKTVGNLEKGMYNVPYLVAVADLFNVSVDYIIGHTDERVFVPKDIGELDLLILDQLNSYSPNEKERLLKHLELENTLKTTNSK